LSACGGENKDSKPDQDAPLSATPSTGIFLDSLVEGLKYETPTFSGTTNSAGEYDYMLGETVTFSIGDIVLGTVNAGPVVTPLTLVPNATDPTDPVVTNIVRLLLTLDDDGDPNNGISISSATSGTAAGLSVDFTAADLSADIGVSGLLSALPGSPTLVDATIAQTHFSETLAAQSTWGGMSWGSGTFRSVHL